VVTLVQLQASAATMAHAETATDNLYLDMDLSQLMQVTVTSVGKKPQTLANTPAAVYVISQEDIRRSGATSIPEVLAMAPGIQVSQISSSKWSVSSRGFSGFISNKLLVLIDGRSVYSPAYSGVFWDAQNAMLEDIDRIEVIRGPGGTIWGANAVNGVINIITKKAQDTQGGLLRAGAGDQEQLQGAARYGGKIGESAFARFYAMGNDRAGNQLAGSGQDAKDGWNTIQTGFRADGAVGNRNEWTLQGDIYRNRGDQIILPYWLPTAPYVLEKHSDFDEDGGNLLGTWQHRMGSHERLSLQLYYDYTANNQDWLHLAYQTLDATVQYETRLGERNDITAGLGFRRIEGDNTSTFQTVIPNRTNEIYSLFLQDAFHLVPDHLTLTLGSKYEHNPYTGSEWQPSGKLLWAPNERHSYWASIARAVHTPSAWENDAQVAFSTLPPPFGAGYVFSRGSEDFTSDTALSYEAGYRWQPHQRFSLDIALFYTVYDDLHTFRPRPTATGMDLVFTNGISGHNYGVELAATWKPAAWLALAGTYGYLQSDYDPETPGYLMDQSLSVFFEKLSPVHQFGLRSSIDLAANWQLNGWLQLPTASPVAAAAICCRQSGPSMPPSTSVST
jgi:iron complex outermembrane receptor protein